MISISYKNNNYNLDNHVDILIITSKHSIPWVVKNYKKINPNKIICVGETLKKKISNELMNVDYCYKDSIELIESISKFHNKNFLYTRGKHISNDINFYNNKSFEVITYEAEKVNNFSNGILDLLNNNEIKYISVYSKRCLEILLDLFNKNNIDPDNFTYFCLSNEIGKVLSKDFYYAKDKKSKTLIEIMIKNIKLKN